MVKTQLLRVQNVHTKYRKYFRGFFNSRLLKNREIRENLMYREYFRVYSTWTIAHNGGLYSRKHKLLGWKSTLWE